VSFSIHLEVEDPRWRKSRGLAARLTAAAELALKRAKAPKKAALTILLAGDARLKRLNHDFRGKNTPTNVLSFPSGAPDYLGDIALAFGVTEKEAKTSGKRFAHHAAHLAVHGVLHLLGHDHEVERDAAKMESLETVILAELGIADPYAHEAA
jgi:probable rRNA maturation factor